MMAVHLASLFMRFLVILGAGIYVEGYIVMAFLGSAIVLTLLVIFLLNTHKQEPIIKVDENRIEINFMGNVIKFIFILFGVFIFLFLTYIFVGVSAILLMILILGAILAIPIMFLWLFILGIYVAIFNSITDWVEELYIQRFTISEADYVYNEPPYPAQISSETREIEKISPLTAKGGNIWVCFLKFIMYTSLIIGAGTLFISRLLYRGDISSSLLFIVLILFILLPGVILATDLYRLTKKIGGNPTLAIVITILTWIGGTMALFIIESISEVLYMFVSKVMIAAPEELLICMMLISYYIIIGFVATLLVYLTFPTPKIALEKVPRKISPKMGGVVGFRTHRRVYSRGVYIKSTTPSILILALIVGLLVLLVSESIVMFLISTSVTLITLIIFGFTRQKKGIEDTFMVVPIGSYVQRWPSHQKNWLVGHHYTAVELYTGRELTELYVFVAFGIITTISFLVNIITGMLIEFSITKGLIKNIYSLALMIYFIKDSLKNFLRYSIYPDLYIGVKTIASQSVFISREFIKDPKEIGRILSIISNIVRREIPREKIK